MMKRESQGLNISPNSIKLRRYRITGSGEYYYYKQGDDTGILRSKDHAETKPDKPDFEIERDSSPAQKQA